MVLEDAIEFKEKLLLVPARCYEFVMLVKGCHVRFVWNIEFLGVTKVTLFSKITIRFGLG